MKIGVRRYEDQKKKPKSQEAKDLLTKILLAHVPVCTHIFTYLSLNSQLNESKEF